MDLASPEFFRRIGRDPADVISFSGGWVNHDAPPELQRAYSEVASDARAFHASGGYSPTLGIPECRRALAEYQKHVFCADMKLGPEQIVIGANSTQLTLALMNAVLGPGDRCLLLDPSYCNYPAQISDLAGVELVRFQVLDPERWTYELETRMGDLVQFIWRVRPKLILLVAPDNPTSQVPSTALVRNLLGAAEETGAILAIDFAYKELVWDDAYPEYFGWGPNDNFVAIHSNSKWCRGLGRRLGWIQAPEYIVEALEVVQSSSILCPDTLHQMALARYITAGIAADVIRPYIRRTAEEYKRAAQTMIEAIRRYLGLPVLEPRGGLYVVMKVGMDGSEFARRALELAGVVVVPGWGFGESLRNAVRLSYGPLVREPDKIVEGVRRLGQVLERVLGGGARG